MQAMWWVYVGVFFGKLAEVSLSSLRSQLIVKGERLGGSLIAAVEYLFWFFITATVLDAYASDPLMIVLLVVAYASGQALGSVLEERLALGACMLLCIFRTREDADNAAGILRSKGFALTLSQGEGIENQERLIMTLVVRRKQLEAVRKEILSVDPHAVIMLTPSVRLEGGTLAPQGAK